MTCYFFIFITLQVANFQSKTGRWRSDFWPFFAMKAVFGAQFLRHLADFVEVEYPQKYFFGTSETALFGAASAAPRRACFAVVVGPLPARHSSAPAGASLRVPVVLARSSPRRLRGSPFFFLSSALILDRG